MAEVLKAMMRIFERGRKKNTPRNINGVIQSKRRENHGDTKTLRIVFLSVSVVLWFKKLIRIYVNRAIVGLETRPTSLLPSRLQSMNRGLLRSLHRKQQRGFLQLVQISQRLRAVAHFYLRDRQTY